MQEIERKFLVSQIPSSILINPETEERFFLYIDGTSEIRIQNKGERYTLQTKSTQSNLASDKQTIELTKEQYEGLKDKAISELSRDTYAIPGLENARLKVYRGRFEGLMRAEFEFTSEDEARQFIAPDWLGREITESPLGRDSKLVNLDQNNFIALLAAE